MKFPQTKRQKFVFCLIFLILGVFAFKMFVKITFYGGGQGPSDDVLIMREMLAEEKYLIHAAGAVTQEDERYIYTNSKEALEASILAGNHIIEVDVTQSADGHYICGHSFGKEYPWINGVAVSEPMKREDFLNQKLFGFLTPMDWEYVAEVMRNHENIYVLPDIKNDYLSFYSMIQESYPDLMNRLLVNIFDVTEYSAVHDMGFPFIIFAVAKMKMQFIIMDADAIEERWNLLAFSFPAEWCDIKSNLFNPRALFAWIKFKEIMPTSVSKLVYTVNDREQQWELFDMGIAAIITDETDNNADSVT